MADDEYGTGSYRSYLAYGSTDGGGLVVKN